MSADEMFEELGYKLEDERICPHSYKYIKENKKNFSAKEIIMEKSTKWIDICYYKIGTDGKMIPIICIEHYISMQELAAINAKCRELGWTSDKEATKVRQIERSEDSNDKNK